MEQAMAKLLKQPVPVKVQKFPFQVAQLKTELEKFKTKGKARLSRFKFWITTPGPIERQAKLLEEKIQTMEAQVIEGFLHPITERELWQCKAHYASTRMEVRQSFDWVNVPEKTRAFQEQAVDFVSDNALLSWQLSFVLKDADGKRVMTPKDASELDPRVLGELFSIYTREFVLTEDEKKK